MAQVIRISPNQEKKHLSRSDTLWTMTQKRQFLKSKGLTDADIDIACVRAGVPLVDPPPLPRSPSFASPHTVLESHRTSWGKTLRDVLEIAALLGGVAYGVYHFWKVIILEESWSPLDLVRSKSSFHRVTSRGGSLVPIKRHTMSFKKRRWRLCKGRSRHSSSRWMHCRCPWKNNSPSFDQALRFNPFP